MGIRIAIAAAAASLSFSFAAAGASLVRGRFDGEKPFTMSGTVAGVEWANPHMHFSIDVKADDGKVTRWRFEGYPPNMLVRQGWQKDVTMKVGDDVTVDRLARAQRSESRRRAQRDLCRRPQARGGSAGRHGRPLSGAQQRRILREEHHRESHPHRFARGNVVAVLLLAVLPRRTAAAAPRRRREAAGAARRERQAGPVRASGSSRPR